MATKIKSTFLISLFILLFSFSSSILAIVSLENFHLTEPKPGFSGYFTLNVDGALGNEDRRTYQLDNRIQHAKGKNLHFLSANYAYSESFNKTSQNQAFLHLRRIQKIWSASALEFFNQVEKNEFSRLSLRALLGTGLRFEFKKANNYTAFLGTGLFYSHERLEAPLNDKIQEVKGNFYAVFKQKFKDNMVFVNTLYFQPVLKNPKDFRILETLAFRFTLSKRLSLQLSLEANHDSRSPLSVKKTDLSYITGVSFNF